MNKHLARLLISLIVSLMVLLPITPHTMLASPLSHDLEFENPDPQDSVSTRNLPCAIQINEKNYTSYRECNFPANRQAAEVGARNFLAHYADTLEIASPEDDLTLTEIKHGLASSHSRFQQVSSGHPIFGAYISIHQGPDGHVQTLHTNYYTNLQTKQPAKEPLPIADAQTAGRTAAHITSLRQTAYSRLIWFPKEDNTAVLAWEMTLFAEKPLGDFLTIVDAYTGQVLFQENRLALDTGSGYVYIPNPYQTQGNGTGMDDNNDTTSTILDTQRISVTLQGLNSGTGLLMGEYVDLATLNSSTLPDNDANEPSRVYQYDRDDDRFEQVVIYHSIDSIQRHFQALGFSDSNIPPNGIRDFATMANAHWYDQDQSYYSTGDDAVHFGDGGIDDGEDADIVAHEYGHAVQHNQNASWGGGEMGAMGEGFGDYLAASFYLAAGNPTFQATNGPCVGERDATTYSPTNPPCLRRTDGTKIYPDDLTGGVHADGEIWSRALWDFRVAIGPSADAIVLEHHFALPSSATMPTAALEVLQANQNLNGGANDAIIRQSFCDRGILTGNDCVSPVADFGLDTAPAELGICVSDDAVYIVSARSLNGFTDPVTLSANGQPAGTTASFDVNPIIPADTAATSTLTISNTGAATAGNYTIDIVGIAPTSTHTSTVQLNVYDSTPGTTTLTTPDNGTTSVSVTPTFSWTTATQGGNYDLEVATDTLFNVVVYSATIAGTNHTPTSTLNSNTTYYWHVRPSNACSTGNYSTAFTFSTESLPGECGTGTTPNILLSDDFESGAPGWTHSGTGDTWTLSTSRPHGGTYAYYAEDVSITSDQQLYSPAVALPTDQNPLTLQFWNHQTIESNGATACYDGSIIEISTNGGSAWTQLESELLTDPYDGPVSALGNINGWCGDPQDWLNSIVDLDAYAGQTAQFRFRLGTDSSTGREGWYIDDVIVQSCAGPQSSIVLTKTVGTNPFCAATDVITLPIGGGDATYCYQIKNTGDIALTLHNLVDDQLGTILNDNPTNLEPGVSAWVTTTATITETTVNTATWTAYNPGPSDVAEGTDSATVIVTFPEVSVAFTKTVGTDPAVCATTDAITLPIGGGDATYCYAVENTGNITLTLHNLVDDQLGTILSEQALNLEPGESAWVTATATITKTTVNTATWTAYNPGSIVLVSSTNSATVIVPTHNVVYLPLVVRAFSP
ncbi:MAG: hypothetical protein GY832_08535 [Chloroflexi bacterium]|nr:hypothetical protein [Chloroflexota bacterium]